MRVERYSSGNQVRWDRFVRRSKNGTFLFFRDYMDYQRDRFEDHSLVVWDGRGRLIALLPANRQDDVFVSHRGLTYGGFVTDEKMHAALMLDVFEGTLSYLKQQSFVRFVYKAIPHIYHRMPAEEDAYALFRVGAALYRRDVSTVVVPSLPIKFQDRRARSIKKARRAGVSWGPSTRYDEFWPILEENLSSRHGVKPVHTLPEILSLQDAFPDNIHLFCANLNDEILGGTVVYETETVAHAQYIASAEAGRELGALDLLFSGLLTQCYKDKPYFDFGISTESEGRELNEGLIAFKEGFGGRAITHDFYQISLLGSSSPFDGARHESESP